MTARWNNLPGRCKCSHAAVLHTGRTSWCNSTSCACREYRDAAEIAGAMERHPSSWKAIR